MIDKRTKAVAYEYRANHHTALFILLLALSFLTLLAYARGGFSAFYYAAIAAFVLCVCNAVMVVVCKMRSAALVAEIIMEKAKSKKDDDGHDTDAK